MDAIGGRRSTDCAPSASREPATIFATAPRNGYGGKMIDSPGAFATDAATSVAKALASPSVVGFIFQLPPITDVRICTAAGAPRAGDADGRGACATSACATPTARKARIMLVRVRIERA